MKISIIADDLTGACDTGIQLVNYGMKVSVSIQESNKLATDAVIYNTDSRSVESHEAYEKVKNFCHEIKNNNPSMIYKKIDSTMRGNIGSEINAVYDVFSPDFIFITPSHPGNGRTVKHGLHYLHGNLLSETEIAFDPKTPVNEANITKLIQSTSKRPVNHLNFEDLRKGKNYISGLLRKWKKQGVCYVTVDAVDEKDLKEIMKVYADEYSIILCGSAGLMNYAPFTLGLEKKHEKAQISIYNTPALFVVGSISKRGREQLSHLINNTNIVRVELNTVELLSGNAEKELLRVFKEIKSAINNERSVVFFSSGDVEKTKMIGIEKGFSDIYTSNMISEELGNLSVLIIKETGLKNLFLTGGDTAQQVFTKLGVETYQLIDELELGVPIGKIDNSYEINTVTKAGNFGSIEVMTKAFQFFQQKNK